MEREICSTFHLIFQSRCVFRGAFVSDEEVENVVSFLKENAEEVSYDESIAQATVSQESMPGSSKGDDERDSLFC